MEKQKILVFGGSFNPPHNGHSNLIREVFNRVQFDEFLIIPSADRRDKIIDVSGIHRLRMIQLMCAECFPDLLSKIKILEIELNRGRNTMTYETETELKAMHQDAELIFVIGSDMAGDVKTWEEGSRLHQESRFLIYPRGGFPFNENDAPVHAEFMSDPNLPTVTVSSTEIRAAIKQRKPFRHLVPSLIAQYIEQNNLYW